MKTVVVLSDTHRNLAPLDKISRVLAECDYIIHLGDMVSDAREISKIYPEKTYVIAGNNDFYGGESEIVLDIEQGAFLPAMATVSASSTVRPIWSLPPRNVGAISPSTAIRTRRTSTKRRGCSSSTPAA